MKEGYIVACMPVHGLQIEVFGVYESGDKAREVMKSIKKCRYPGMSDFEITDLEIKTGIYLQIIHFIERNGVTHSFIV